jgi:hypothetical protein
MALHRKGPVKKGPQGGLLQVLPSKVAKTAEWAKASPIFALFPDKTIREIVDSLPTKYVDVITCEEEASPELLLETLDYLGVDVIPLRLLPLYVDVRVEDIQYSALKNHVLQFQAMMSFSSFADKMSHAKGKKQVEWVAYLDSIAECELEKEKQAKEQRVKAAKEQYAELVRKEQEAAKNAYDSYLWKEEQRKERDRYYELNVDRVVNLPSKPYYDFQAQPEPVSTCPNFDHCLDKACRNEHSECRDQYLDYIEDDCRYECDYGKDLCADPYEDYRGRSEWWTPPMVDTQNGGQGLAVYRLWWQG